MELNQSQKRFFPFHKSYHSLITNSVSIAEIHKDTINHSIDRSINQSTDKLINQLVKTNKQTTANTTQRFFMEHGTNIRNVHRSIL